MGSKIKTFAEAASQRGSQAGYKFDSLSLLAIIGVIIQMIQMLKDCKLSAPAALRRVKSPSWLDRLRLRDALRKHKVKVKLVDPGVAAILDEAEQLDAATLKAMFEEV